MRTDSGDSEGRVGAANGVAAFENRSGDGTDGGGDGGGGNDGRAAPPAVDVEAIEREAVATALSRLENRRDGDVTQRERDVIADFAASLVAAVAPAAGEVVTVAREGDSSGSAGTNDAIERSDHGVLECSTDGR